MRVLMLGNSFTFFHDMPQILAGLTGWEVVSHTRGGAWLSEQLNPETEMGARTLKALREEKWDYVVLQEQSKAPAVTPEAYRESVRKLSALSRSAGATPVIYASWAYREGSEKLASSGMGFEEMDRRMYESCHRAAEENDCLIADVGRAFYRLREKIDLFEADDYHPSAVGSLLAARTIADTINEHERMIHMSKQVITTTGAPAAIGPYSQAILSGDTLFASGQIAPDAGDVAAQAEKAFDSIEAILAEAGFTLADVVKTTVYLQSMGDFAKVNEVYGRRMPEPYPARSCVEVGALPKGALVEIEVLAKK